METMPIVLDISSEEEEVCWEDERESTLDSYWIKKFVDMRDEELCNVVVLSELNDQEKQEEEDDCFVLDCDPENQLKCVQDSSIDSDDLLLVGEKGQVFSSISFPCGYETCIVSSFVVPSVIVLTLEEIRTYKVCHVINNFKFQGSF